MWCPFVGFPPIFCPLIVLRLGVVDVAVFTFGIFEAQLILRKGCSSLVLWSALLGAMCLPLLGKAPLSENVACKIFAFLRDLHSHSSFPLLFAVSRASLDLPQTEGERKCENEAPFGRSPKKNFLLCTCSSLTCFKKNLRNVVKPKVWASDFGCSHVVGVPSALGVGVGPPRVGHKLGFPARAFLQTSAFVKAPLWLVICTHCVVSLCQNSSELLTTHTL